ncbi:DUF2092 domain-containing protein [Oceanisphaera sp. W20_SRM_FM3]|uniref:DUF2092 domain-containing protein n=1 Tax=Oceanisphaera sp. W20_SRM_FM3 TaxID=3240267 RepID=UPI003F9E114E
MFKQPTCYSRVTASQMLTGVLALFFVLGSPLTTADENDAKQLLKNMSDYLDAQQAYSFDYDAVLDIVTADNQIIGIASSGSASLQRPNKLYATRFGGFANVEMSFDGKTLSVLGKDANQYAQMKIEGDTDKLIDELKNVYHVPMPAADLLLTNTSVVLLENVTDIKDLGTGVVNGVECDSLAFRTDEVDWQIWIAQGDTPYPVRYVITSKQVKNGPQYSIQTRNWQTGDAVAARDYSFKNRTDAALVKLEKLSDASHLPENFKHSEGAAQ